MPELPDITAYITAIEARIVGRVLERVAIISPFLLRTYDPPLSSAEGRNVNALRFAALASALQSASTETCHPNDEDLSLGTPGQFG